MSLPDTCPNCRRALKDTAKAPSMEKRSKPCGWIVCDPKGCGTTLDARGRHYPRKAAAA